MQEACYCGRVGEIVERQPVVDSGGEQALRCPNEACGHMDYLYWLSEDARLRVFEEVSERMRREQSLTA